MLESSIEVDADEEVTSLLEKFCQGVAQMTGKLRVFIADSPVASGARS
jgi:hypothetical protein